MALLKSTLAGLALTVALAVANPAQANFVATTGGATFAPTLGSSFFSDNANGAGGDIALITESPAQSPANINLLVNNLFDVSASLVGTGTVSGLSADGKSGTISGGSFNFAAIHAGKNEYALQFASLTSSFTFAGLGAGFSNVRLYAAVVPLPGAALLFGSALAGLAWVRRRSINADASAAVA